MPASNEDFVKIMQLHARARGVRLGRAGQRVIQHTACAYADARKKGGALEFDVALGPVTAADEEDVRAAIMVVRGLLRVNIARTCLRREGEQDRMGHAEGDAWTLHVVGVK